MLKGKFGSSKSSSDSNGSGKPRVSPPPIPPKPRTNSIVGNNMYNNSNSWKCFSTKSDTYSPIEAANKSNTSQTYDAHYQAMQLDDNNDQNYRLESSSVTPPPPPSIPQSTANSRPSLPLPTTTTMTAFKTTTKIMSMLSNNQPTEVYISNDDNIYLNEDTADNDIDDDYDIDDNCRQLAQNDRDDYRQLKSSSGSQSNPKPIVTEPTKEANNNNNSNSNSINNNNNISASKQNKKIMSTSTVEILEVPLKRYSPSTKQNKQHHTIATLHDNNSSYLSPNFNDPQFRNQPHQHVANAELFYENNNSYAAPVVTTTTDDEEEDELLPTEAEVETILNESSLGHNQPPRTSTPNINNNKYALPIREIINNPKSQNNSNNNTGSEDTVNISIETDDIPITPLNQSGGGEVVGIFETSDQANNSKDSVGFQNTMSNHYQDKMPFSTSKKNITTNQQPLMDVAKQDCSQEHSLCQEKLREFENITHSMADEIDKLKTQITNLTSKVGELEVQVDKQQQVTIRENEESACNRSALNISSTKQTYRDSFSPIQSISMTNATRAIPSNIQPQSSSSRYLTSTYSRNNSVGSMPRSSSSYPSPCSYSKPVTTQSYNNTVTKPLRKNIQHASTNSLYAESLKSCSTSISPTSNYNTNQRRDPMSYTSLLSLSSIGGSTLKKSQSSAATGSVSNLSQAANTSLAAQWPSLSDFLPAKHRAKEIIFDENDRTINMVLYNRLITMQLPRFIENNYNLDKIVEPPVVRLKLDWVHGYRGRDCRSNIFHLPTGECIYFVASIVVLYNPDERTQRHYLGHTDSVKCLAVHPNKLIVASGQSVSQSGRDKRPIVRVWNTVNLTTIRVIGFNEDFDCSICCLAFSKHDQGATLAVVDESNEHTITLLDWQREKNWRLAETNSGHEQVLAIDFHPVEKYSLVAVGKSSINFWDTRGMTLTKRAGLFDKYDKPKYVLCLTFNDLGDTVTGDSNGSIIIWPKGCNRPKRIIHDAHQGGVFSVLAMKDGTYLSGGRDRRIVEWDENFEPTGKEAELPEHCGGVRYITYARGSLVLIGTLRNSILLGSLKTNFTLIMRGHSEAITSLAVHPNQNRYITGGFDDQIHLFDSKTHEVVWSKSLMMPVTAASFSPDGSLLVIGSTIGKWLVLDAVTQEISFTKCDGSGTINCIKFSPSGENFCLASSDCHAYIYQTTGSFSKFSRVGACVGHSAPIKEVDWSEDGRFIQTQSMNFELLFWKVLNCRPADETDGIDDLKWSTHNCTLGFNVIGIWSDSIDSSRINHCDKSNNEDLVVSVTDAGSINVFKWPPCYSQCLSQKYYGNVEKLNFIKFSSDDSKLIAIGAKSCVITEWCVDKDALLDQ